jgi:hypothetical protein
MPNSATDLDELARRRALARPRSTEHDDAPPDWRKVLRAFVVDGRITAMPTKHSKRMILLEWVSQDFDPGRRYSETAVNLILGRLHADTAALRRYLVDAGFMDRADGQYWRSGGIVEG